MRLIFIINLDINNYKPFTFHLIKIRLYNFGNHQDEYLCNLI